MCYDAHFDHRHYVPMLRGKPAEFDALKKLAPQVKDRLTPFVEVPVKGFRPQDSPTPAEVTKQLRKYVDRIGKSWSGRRLFLYLGHLDPMLRGMDGRHPVEIVWQEAAVLSLFPPTPVPVVSPDSDAAYKEAVLSWIAGTGVGMCLRLGMEHLQFGLQGVIDQLLLSFGLSPSQVDLVFDFGLVDETGFDLTALSSSLPYITDWRTFTTVGGAFPVDLRGFEPGENENPRLEWSRYREQVAAPNNLIRVPTYGDYTIQHPIYIEPVDDARPSASLRYTRADDTLILRGESLTKDGGGGFKQYPAQAQLLADHPDFQGAEFSYGDTYIREMADKAEQLISQTKSGGTGNPKTWLCAGINHHMTFLTEQIASLFGF